MCSTYFESRSRLRIFQSIVRLIERSQPTKSFHLYENIFRHSRKSRSLPALCNRLLSQEVEQKICYNIICFPSDEEEVEQHLVEDTSSANSNVWRTYLGTQGLFHTCFHEHSAATGGVSIRQLRQRLRYRVGHEQFRFYGLKTTLTC